jgi:hypothetical protein
MRKQKAGNLSQDLDIFGDIGGDSGEESNNDLFGTGDSEEISADELLGDVKEETPAEPVVAEEPIKEEVIEEPEATTKEEDDEFNKLVDEILNGSTEVDDKVEEIKQQAEDEGNQELIDMIDELQKLLSEKNLQIEELQKSKEMVNGKYLDRYAETEGLMIHKDVIEKLEADPKLMMLVKYSDSDNEKIKDRVLNILTDMIYKQTGQDVRELLDTAQKDSIGAIMSTPDSQASLDIPKMEKEDKDMTFEESIQNLF